MGKKVKCGGKGVFPRAPATPKQATVEDRLDERGQKKPQFLQLLKTVGQEGKKKKKKGKRKKNWCLCSLAKSNKAPRETKKKSQGEKKGGGLNEGKKLQGEKKGKKTGSQREKLL